MRVHQLIGDGTSRRAEIRIPPALQALIRRGRPRGDLRWWTFLRLHAQGIIACDFLVAVTAPFRQLYVFVVIEHRTRPLIHCNVTTHPSAA